MPDYRRAISLRLPPELALKRDFSIVATARSHEALRQAIRREVRVHTSLRALALRIGVDRGTLRKFLAMESVPQPHNLAKIENRAADRPEVWTPLGAVALSVLVLELPAQRRSRARRELAGVLASTYTEAGLPVPEWLCLECNEPEAR